MKMIPLQYQTHLKSQLNQAEYLLLSLLIQLLQTIRQVKLETLATALPLPILFESRRKKLNDFFPSRTGRLRKFGFPLLAIG